MDKVRKTGKKDHKNPKNLNLADELKLLVLRQYHYFSSTHLEVYAKYREYSAKCENMRRLKVKVFIIKVFLLLGKINPNLKIHEFGIYICHA